MIEKTRRDDWSYPERQNYFAELLILEEKWANSKISKKNFDSSANFTSILWEKIHWTLDYQTLVRLDDVLIVIERQKKH